jgi:hypothetical protein
MTVRMLNVGNLRITDSSRTSRYVRFVPISDIHRSIQARDQRELTIRVEPRGRALWRS